MIRHLENILYEKTKGTQSEILFAQWNYDKKIIPTALNAVSSLFPHYSLHDETHSITIINNIVRILGVENIEKLSAIDIWLILEASYSHDIGMVVTSEELIKSLKSNDFITFFKDLIKDEKSGLHEFASQFEIVENQIKYKSNYLNLELHDGIKFILAEFFRNKHSNRSKEIIVNPAKTLSMSSPRGVIPQRIFKILGDICASHTKDFEEVLDLPFCEVGIDIDDAHPRFIACLLRIGDLLDLDNNRFSEVMLRTLTKIPIDTLNHKSKHLSIESFRVDREKIEVAAKCNNYDTANITQHWFNYLNSEISQQMINWNNIVPFKELGYLPTIGNLKVELSDYDYIDGKNKPKFRVDTDKALGLLQGAGLYDGAYQCIREILQNAVDATLIRIWLEHKESKDYSTPQSCEYLEIIKDYPITINIIEKEVKGEFKNWLIEIIDNGTGISNDDLKFLMNTGSSSKNKTRTNIIDSMPKWMQPSGTFGIGFQSIFMLSNVVNIETKSFFDEKLQFIELNSPNSPKNGDILIQRKKSDHSVKPSTKITLNHKTIAIPDRYTIKGEHRNASRIAHNYDPFSHESMDIELGKVLDEIFDFAYKSYFPIKLNIGNESIETRSDKAKQFDFFEEENSLELKFHFEAKENRWNTLSYYKSQSVENNLRLKFLGIECNIHKDKASKVLTLNRNKIRPEYNETLYKDLMYSTFKLLTSNFDNIFKEEKDKAIGSMFLNYYSNEEMVKQFNISQFDHWGKLKINVGEIEMSIESLLHSIESLKIIYDNTINPEYGDLYILKEKELTIKLRGGTPSYDYTDFFLYKASEVFKSFSKSSDPSSKVKEVLFTKEKQTSPITKGAFEKILKSLKGSYSTARRILPCLEEFFSLRLKENAFIPYVHPYRFDDHIYLSYPKMLSPFVSEQYEERKYRLNTVLNDKIYDWVFENRYDIKTTRDEIIESYKLFLETFKVEDLDK
ncbi:ATP-binding protein [Labilibaculum sp.]|uniref:HD domain-containing protein n=1 Tax=Labilibaculum sp. TaxID=2060723 RepID=UPI003563F960